MATSSKPARAPADLKGQLWDPLFASAPIRRLKTDETLFSAGDAGDGVYRLEDGLLKVQMDSPSGEKRIISTLCPGALVGELSLIDGLPRSATVIALGDSILRFVSREAFQRHVSNHPAIFQKLAAVLSLRLRDADATIAASTFLPVRARVARALLELARLTGGNDGDGRVVIDLMVSKADLAAMAGVARENASRVFSDFRKRKVVTVLPHGIRLNDIAALQRELTVD